MKQRLDALEGLEKLLVKDAERLSREARKLNLNALELEDFSFELAEAEKMRAELTMKAGAIVVAPDERTRKIKFLGLACGGAVALVPRVKSPTEAATAA